MRTIWKFPLKVTDRQGIELPADATILCIEMQNGTPCLWAEVLPYNGKLKREIVTFGTGHEIPFAYNGRYIGTYQTQALVFHVYETLIP